MPKIAVAAFVLTAAAAQAAPLNYTPLYTFPAPPTGESGASGAYGPLISANNHLYGVESGFVPGNITAEGAVYAVGPFSGGSTVYTFANQADGSEPSGTLVYLNSLLYGVTIMGGATNEGTLYSVDPVTGSHQVLFSFNGSNFSAGFQPMAGLTYLNGLLYGTTIGGGSLNGSGTVFSFDPASGAVTFLHGFASNNTYPSALTAVGNTLYGTTQSGGTAGAGIIFATDSTTGMTRTVYNFAAGSDGTAPTGVVYLNGSLYGTTIEGGYHGSSACRRAGCGVLFAYDLTSGVEQVLYDFKEVSGQPRPGPLTVVNNDLVGGDDVTFGLDPATGKLSILYTYDALHPGTIFSLLYANHTLYGASNGGAAPGVVYALTQ